MNQTHKISSHPVVFYFLIFTIDLVTRHIPRCCPLASFYSIEVVHQRWTSLFSGSKSPTMKLPGYTLEAEQDSILVCCRSFVAPM